MRAGASLGTIALAALVACTAAESQGGGGGQDALTLESKLPVSFAAVSNVVELDGKRVAFVDTRDKLFLSADLGSGAIDTLGTRVDSIRPDSPAAQYKFPGWVAHLAGDTVALVDFSAQRTTLWNERGEALKVLPIARAAGSAPVLMYDTVGHGYKVDYSPVLGGGAPGEKVGVDSVAVLRIALTTGRIDTVARLAAPEFGDARFGEQVQQAAVVFAPNDYFGVLPNGTAWVARGRENRVDWRTPQGQWRQGQKRPYTAVPVTQADKDRVLAQVREQGKQFGMPQNLRVEYPFAANKPPFDFALARPNGEVWLQRPRAGDAAPAVYDVHTADGSRRREVAFPQGSSLAGFGTDGAIYGTIKDGERRTVGRFVMK